MEGEQRRKQFTPMSGELQAMVDFEPHEPAEDDRNRVPPPKRAPASGREVVLHGFGRLALVLTGLTGGVALVAWLVARRSDEPLSHALQGADSAAATREAVRALPVRPS